MKSIPELRKTKEGTLLEVKLTRSAVKIFNDEIDHYMQSQSANFEPGLKVTGYFFRTICTANLPGILMTREYDSDKVMNFQDVFRVDEGAISSYIKLKRK